MPARPQLPLVSVKKNHDGESSGGGEGAGGRLCAHTQLDG